MTESNVRKVWSRATDDGISQCHNIVPRYRSDRRLAPHGDQLPADLTCAMVTTSLSSNMQSNVVLGDRRECRCLLA